ncbi:hypothetical protein [Nocardioides lijunqiniae]|uniref:hypothetical protein n=1 Tax=Nocardioides lijunqiniae TaxID=2760832 RepID=UPI001877E89F|nr:hypothetical protein [Nocardioides lijunqiniae]
MDTSNQHASTAGSDADTRGGTVARAHELPIEVHQLCTLERIDYFDAFRTSNPQTKDWSAGRWARHVLADASLRTRVHLVAGWSTLGLKVNPARNDRILGWPIESQTADHVVLATRSPWGISAQLVFARHESEWWFGTLLTLDGALARTAWSVIRPVHLSYVRTLLQQADARA